MASIKVDDKRVFPSLTEGWVSASLAKLDALLSCWLVSDYSQSEVFHGHIVSLPKMIAELGHDPEQFVSECETKLSSWLGRYYDGVEVNVSYKFLEAGSSGGPYGVKYEFTALQNGIRVNLAKNIEITNSKLSKIMDIANG